MMATMGRRHDWRRATVTHIEDWVVHAVVGSLVTIKKTATSTDLIPGIPKFDFVTVVATNTVAVQFNNGKPVRVLGRNG